MRLKVTKQELDKLVSGSSIPTKRGRACKYEVEMHPTIAGGGLVGGTVLKFRPSSVQQRLRKGKKVKASLYGPESLEYLQAQERFSGNFLAPGRSLFGKSKGYRTTGKGMVPIGSGFVPIGGKGLLPLGGGGLLSKGKGFTSRLPQIPEQY